MNVQSNKNPIKKLISLVGIAGAGIFLSLPAFAGISTNSEFNQNSPTDSNLATEQLIAQSDSGGGDNSGEGDEVSPGNTGNDDLTPMDNNNNQMSSPRENNRMNEMSSPRETDRMDRMDTSSADEGEMITKPYMHNTALRRLEEGSWRCFNNPRCVD